MSRERIEIGDLVAVAITRGRRTTLVHLPVVDRTRRRIQVEIDRGNRMWVNPQRVSVVRRKSPPSGPTRDITGTDTIPGPVICSSREPE